MNPFTSGSCGVFEQWNLDVSMPFPRKYLNIVFLSLGGPNSLHLPARGQGLRFAGLAVENHQNAGTESLAKLWHLYRKESYIFAFGDMPWLRHDGFNHLSAIDEWNESRNMWVGERLKQE
jgi:hypothetical protein